MRLKFALSAVGAAATVALFGCGGGGGGGGGFPIVALPTTPPAETPVAPVTPAPETPLVPPETPPTPEPTKPTLVTWKDIDCSHDGTALPKCSVDFSDNDADVTIADDDGARALQFRTGNTPLATKADGPNNDVAGNLAALGLGFLHEMKLSDFPGLQYDAKGADAAAGYTNITVSVNCNGTLDASNPYINLVLTSAQMTQTPSPENAGYTRHVATPASAAWVKSGGTALKHPSDANITLLNALNGADNAPLSLAALMAAYPNACIYNYANPVAAGITPTPAVLFKLGDSTNVSAFSYLIKGITSAPAQAPL